MNKYPKIKICKLLDEVNSLQKKNLIKNFICEDLRYYTKSLSKLAEETKAHRKPLLDIEKRFANITQSILDKGYRLDKGLRNRVVSKKIRRIFQKLVRPFVFKSMLSKRGYNKPFGYPGDYKVIEWIYNNKPISHGFGYYIDRYMLNDDYIEAIKNRKEKMKEILKNFLENSEYNKKEEKRVLNIGCGSSRELRELGVNLSTKNRIIFTLIDQEKKALEFSKKELSKVSDKNVKFNFIRDNIASLLAQRNHIEIYRKLKDQDLIYSIGLVDYLPDFYFEKMIKFSFDILKKNHDFIFAHKNIVRYPSLASDWICDWNFISRSKDSVLEVIKVALKKYKYDIKIEETGNKRIYFVFLTKR